MLFQFCGIYGLRISITNYPLALVGFLLLNVPIDFQPNGRSFDTKRCSEICRLRGFLRSRFTSCLTGELMERERSAVSTIRSTFPICVLLSSPAFIPLFHLSSCLDSHHLLRFLLRCKCPGWNRVCCFQASAEHFKRRGCHVEDTEISRVSE